MDDKKNRRPIRIDDAAWARVRIAQLLKRDPSEVSLTWDGGTLRWIDPEPSGSETIALAVGGIHLILGVWHVEDEASKARSTGWMGVSPGPVIDGVETDRIVIGPNGIGVKPDGNGTLIAGKCVSFAGITEGPSLTISASSSASIRALRDMLDRALAHPGEEQRVEVTLGERSRHVIAATVKAEPATYQELANETAAKVNPGAEPPKLHLPTGPMSPIDVTVERVEAPVPETYERGWLIAMAQVFHRRDVEAAVGCAPAGWDDLHPDAREAKIRQAGLEIAEAEAIFQKSGPYLIRYEADPKPPVIPTLTGPEPTAAEVFATMTASADAAIARGLLSADPPPIDVTVERFDAQPRKICSFVPVDPSEPVRPVPPMPEDPDGAVREVRTGGSLFTKKQLDEFLGTKRQELPVPLDGRGVVLTAEVVPGAIVSGAEWEAAQFALDQAALHLQCQGVPATWMLLPAGLKPLVLAPDPRLNELVTMPLRIVRSEAGSFDDIGIPVAPPTYEQMATLDKPLPKPAKVEPGQAWSFTDEKPSGALVVDVIDPMRAPHDQEIAFFRDGNLGAETATMLASERWAYLGVAGTVETRSPCAAGHPEDETCDLCRGVQIDGQGAEPARDGKDFDPQG